MSHEPIDQHEARRERNHRGPLSGRYLESVVETVEMIGFWAAVTLPFLYVPLFVSGLDTLPQRITLVGLIALNAIALLVGHRHKRN